MEARAGGGSSFRLALPLDGIPPVLPEGTEPLAPGGAELLPPGGAP
jgi:hypothetical protein